LINFLFAGFFLRAFSSDKQTPFLIAVCAPLDFIAPASVDSVVIFFTEFLKSCEAQIWEKRAYFDKLGFCFGENFELSFENFDEAGSVVDILDVDEACFSDCFAVVFHGKEIVSALRDVSTRNYCYKNLNSFKSPVILAPFIWRAAVVRNHESSAGLQPFQELLEQRELVSDMQNRVSRVYHVESRFWEFDERCVLDRKENVLELVLLGALICDVDHILRQIETLKIC